MGQVQTFQGLLHPVRDDPADDAPCGPEDPRGRADRTFLEQLHEYSLLEMERVAGPRTGPRHVHLGVPVLRTDELRDLGPDDRLAVQGLGVIIQPGLVLLDLARSPAQRTGMLVAFDVHVEHDLPHERIVQDVVRSGIVREVGHGEIPRRRNPYLRFDLVRRYPSEVRPDPVGGETINYVHSVDRHAIRSYGQDAQRIALLYTACPSFASLLPRSSGTSFR